MVSRFKGLRKTVVTYCERCYSACGSACRAATRREHARDRLLRRR